MKNKSTTENPSHTHQKFMIFRKENYFLIGLGIIFLAIGYILLIGGGSDDPNVFNEAIFNTRRLVVAPIFLLIGYILPIIAIFFIPKNK